MFTNDLGAPVLRVGYTLSSPSHMVEREPFSSSLGKRTRASSESCALFLCSPPSPPSPAAAARRFPPHCSFSAAASSVRSSTQHRVRAHSECAKECEREKRLCSSTLRGPPEVHFASAARLDRHTTCTCDCVLLLMCVPATAAALSLSSGSSTMTAVCCLRAAQSRTVPLCAALRADLLAVANLPASRAPHSYLGTSMIVTPNAPGSRLILCPVAVRMTVAKETQPEQREPVSATEAVWQALRAGVLHADQVKAQRALLMLQDVSCLLSAHELNTLLGRLQSSAPRLKSGLSIVPWISTT
mmetsp:Transcript_20740/g.52521  ORF Transcript_20740/g.52521 Transcript_20740/m.52521 type:complete len:300 (-) Transcript_20740:1343-2242(-)